MSTKSRVGERARHREMVAEALGLHARGASIPKISAELGVTTKRASRLISEGLAATPEQTADEVLVTAQLRLDVAADTARELLNHADPRVRLQAARDLASIEGQRTRMTGTWLKPAPDPAYDLPRR